MKLDTNNRKPWAIPRELERIYSVERIEEVLDFFDRASDNNYYVVDYHKQKLIMGRSANATFLGYSKSAIVKEGFEVYKHILKPSELKWLENMHNQAFDVFNNCPESQRQKLEFIYYLIVKNMSNHEIILRHKLVPYQLDDNKNMWLGLVFVTPTSFLPIHKKASIVNIETADVYDYIDGCFILSKIELLDNEEIKILELLSQDIQVKNIRGLLKVSSSCLDAKRQKIFKKLKVQSWTAAVHKAGMMGVLPA
jgi:hypothetical protein